MAAFFNSYPLSYLIYVCITSNLSVALYYSFSLPKFLTAFIVFVASSFSYDFYYYYPPFCSFPSWICNNYLNVFTSISNDSLGGVAIISMSLFFAYLYLQLFSSLSIISTETFPILY